MFASHQLMCTFIGGGPPSLNGPPKSKMLENPVTTVFTLLESLRVAPATRRSATLASSYGSYRITVEDEREN